MENNTILAFFGVPGVIELAILGLPLLIGGIVLLIHPRTRNNIAGTDLQKRVVAMENLILTL